MKKRLEKSRKSRVMIHCTTCKFEKEVIPCEYCIQYDKYELNPSYHVNN